MKFLDELSKLYEFEQQKMTLRNYKEPYNEGLLDGIELAENHIKRLESSGDGALEMLKRSIKDLFS